MTFRSVATVLTDRCRLDGRGLDALLSENTRLAKRKLETGRLKVVDLVSREGRWGWDGACLETVSAIAHDPYGAVTMFDGPASTLGDWTNPHTVSSVGNTLLYASMVLDPVTGLYYDEARWYSTSVSTFISRDPLKADINLYRYCTNSPVGATDPRGLDEYRQGCVDGYAINYWVAKGVPSMLANLAGITSYPGPWGQLATATSGSLSWRWGAETTVNLSGGNVCNTILPGHLGSVDAGEIRVSVILPAGCYEVLWNWEVSSSGNALGGSASVTAPSGTMSNKTEVLPSSLLNPGFHAGGAEKTCVRGGNWYWGKEVQIADYNPVLSRSGGTGSDGKTAQSSTTGRITILQIKKMGN